MKKHTKQSKAVYVLCMSFLSVTLLGSLNVSAQISVAPYPITAGTFGSSFSYNNTQNSTNYANYYERSINDISYKFILTTLMDVTITHCGSSLSDTYLYLFDVNGSTIDYNDDYRGAGACSSTLRSVIKKTLPAGTYYAISEEYSSNGLITTKHKEEPAANNTVGNTFQNPIVMGESNFSFNYSNSQNTEDFIRRYF